MRFEQIVELHPQPTELDREVLLRLINECLDCGESCIACADASLGEADALELVRSIRLCLDCAESCEAVARIAVRQTASDPDLLRAITAACAVACLSCAEECERHAEHHAHHRVCAEACRECKAACDDLLARVA
jgi:hypothetical protein